MYVSDLALTDFRSYEHVVVSLKPGITAFVGPNGQGKTNLVEAIAYLATFTSHRVAGDAALVRAGTPRAIVQAKVMKGAREVVLVVEIISGKANRARLNRAPSRPRDLLGHVRAVLFAPEDLALVKGEPSGRRRFLDELLVLFTPRLAGVQTEYDRVIKQRNALLKTAGAARRRGASPDLATLDIWDAKAAKAGAELTSARVDLLTKLRPYLQQAYDEVSGVLGQADALYSSRLSGEDEEIAEPSLMDTSLVEAQLLEAMSRLREREMERGVTLVGPHRDDIDFVLRGLPARGYASHGESWSYALALRLASYELLKADSWSDGDPILILDDVLAELDSQRRQRLADMVADAQQVLITAAVAEDIPITLNGGRIDVVEGEVSRVY